MEPKPFHVLLVEDNPADGELIGKLLEEAGTGRFQVTTVAHLKDALSHLYKTEADVVLLDLTLPDSHGKESARRILQAFPAVPLLVLSGRSDEQVATEIVEKGAQDFLVKGRMDGNSLVRAIHYSIERKQMLLRLDQSLQSQKAIQDNFKNVIHNITEGIAVLNPEGAVLYVNPAAENLFGRGADELVGELFGFPMAEEMATEVAIVSPVTGNRSVEVRTADINWENNPAQLVTLRDVTGPKQAAERIRLQGAALEAAANAIMITNVQGRIVWTNPAFAELSGYRLKEVVGENPKILKSDHHPREFFTTLWETILSGKVWHSEIVNQHKEGRLYTVETTITPLRGEHDRITHFVAIMEDVEERKQLEEQLQQAQKLEAVGRLAGGVAHDFNNLLTAITGYSQLILSGIDQEDATKEDLKQIISAGERAASLTQQLLAFSRRQVLQPRVMDLNQIIAGTNKLLGRLIGEDIELVTSFAPHLGRVKADLGQVEQVIMNLAVNARDAMPEGGKLVIETANIDLDEYCYRGRFAVPPGGYVMVSVTDNGCGMDQETVAKTFDPFFTTKGKARGTGLGLSTVYAIIKQNGGYIWIYSEPRHGTTFKIFLPRVEVVAHPMESQGTSIAASNGTETVLLVEDEKTVRQLARRILEKNGYKVLESSNGKEALEVCARHRGPIHLTMTDVIMPEMGGREFAARLRDLRPDIKVLFMSGYSDRAVFDIETISEDSAFLQKPFTVRSLSQKVREVIDQAEDLEISEKVPT